MIIRKKPPSKHYCRYFLLMKIDLEVRKINLSLFIYLFIYSHHFYILYNSNSQSWSNFPFILKICGANVDKTFITSILTNYFDL